MKLKLFTVMLMITFGLTHSQEEKVDMLMFEPVFNSYSPNKTSTLILENGKEIKGLKRDVDRKKGQIYYVKLKDETTGEKLKFNAEEIKEMYLYPGGLEKLSKVTGQIFDARRWGSRDLESDLINKGYIFFKKQTVSLKNKKDERELLMQLINPRFSSIIEVYGDPMAQKTAKLGIAGFNVAGGLAKSYYFKKGDKIFWLQKKNLENYYDSLFGDNEAFMAKYPREDIKWKMLGEYVYMYTKMSLE